MDKKYRLYIDESGTHHYSNSDEEQQRYLSLTGVIVEQETYISDLQPKIEGIRNLFSRDPDDPPILHREEIVQKKGFFTKLNQNDFLNEFNNQFLSLVKETDYTICCVAIDKKTHKERYQASAEHPYHYCLSILLERYARFLQSKRGEGDVMAEARGKREDRELKRAYEQFYSNGTYYIRTSFIQQVLSSKEIKLKDKTKHTAGLELADLLAIPTRKDVLYTYKIIDLKENFTKTIIENIQGRYYRSEITNVVKGCGKKFVR